VAIAPVSRDAPRAQPYEHLVLDFLAYLEFERGLARSIRFDGHCLGCTAGAGSSCGGAIAA
jgi:hypothetical protein